MPFMQSSLSMSTPLSFPGSKTYSTLVRLRSRLRLREAVSWKSMPRSKRVMVTPARTSSGTPCTNLGYGTIRRIEDYWSHSFSEEVQSEM